MIDILRYVLSTSTTSDAFLSGVPNLSDVRRFTLKESCRDILLSSCSASPTCTESGEIGETAERWIGENIQKAIASSPTMSEEERKEASSKISDGCWSELFLGNSISATEAEREGKLVELNTVAGLEGLKKMLHSILTHSQVVWKLSFSNRRDFVADALFDDPDDTQNVYTFTGDSGSNKQAVLQRRQLFQDRFVTALNDLQDDVHFDTERKNQIGDDISFMEYVSLLLPNRFDCEETIECTPPTGVYNSRSGLSAVSAARRTMSSFSADSYYKSIRFEQSDINFQYSPELDDSLKLNDEPSPFPCCSASGELAEFANVSERTAKAALGKAGGDKEKAALILLNLVKSTKMCDASRHLFVSSEPSPSSLDNSLQTTGINSISDSMKLAELAGTSRERARLAIDDAYGNLDEAADLLLAVMCDDHDDPAPALVTEKEEALVPSSIPTATAEPEREVKICDPLDSDSYRILARIKKESEKKSKDQEECLMCPICFTVFDPSIEDDGTKSKEHIPRNLKCGHSFCKSCLKNWVGKKGIPFPCPVCRTKIGYMSYHLKPWLKKTTGKGKKKRQSAPVRASTR